VAAGRGVVVTRVDADGPGARAGLAVGDVITALDDQPVRLLRELRNIEGLLPVGTDVAVAIVREGAPRSLRARLVATLDQLLGDNLDPRLAGALFVPLPERAVAAGLSGVLTSEVAGNGRAARAGLRRGDIVLAVNRTEIDGLAALRAALDPAPEALGLTIVRNNRLYTLPLP
jgi:S1-C subfamily serine protease